MDTILTIILLGIVEGVTEFLPVSSTGHLILAGALMGYDEHHWMVFNIVIQLGAILAVIVLYWRTFLAVLTGLARREPQSWRFVRNILVAFIPAAVIGLALHDRIEAMLGSPLLVAVALIVGGVAILLIEWLVPEGREKGVADIGLGRVIAIGFIQCLAMIPGVSRSGATILGALSMGVERRTAAEFSFFLAIPTMLGATTLELWKNRNDLGEVGMSGIALGFVVSFIVALVVIRWFIGIISRRGFAPFAWYRIVAGGAALVWLLA
jgi:undecaprenyl-diphosphatase